MPPSPPRAIAEGAVELSQLLLVTFGRMATNELRLRVRERLVSVENCLADAVAQRVPTRPPSALGGNAFDRSSQRSWHVAASGCRAHSRVRCRDHRNDARVLPSDARWPWVLGDREPHATVVEHISDLTREVMTDLYLRRYATNGSPPMNYDEALEIANQAVEAVHARLVPAGLAPDDPSGSGERVAFATAVRREVERRKRASKLFTYDDMLTRLRDALADPSMGRPLPNVSGSATASSWWTSSKTPIPSSGKSSAARSTDTPR